MPVKGRQGVTLPDALVGLVLLGLLGLLVTRTAVRAERTARSQEARARLHLAFDAGLAWLAAEFADLGPEDILSVAPDSVRYRGTRGLGILCQVAHDEVRLLSRQFTASRAPQPGRDSLLVPLLPDLPVGADTTWIGLPLLSVRQSSCGAEAALALGTIVDTLRRPPALLPARLPVRLFEVMQARFYPSLGATWLGARSVSAGEVIQPLAGPFSANGTRFVARDTGGAPTGDPRAVQRITLDLAGTRFDWAGGTGTVVESASVDLSPANLLP